MPRTAKTYTPKHVPSKSASVRALGRIGKIINRKLNLPIDLVRITQEGVAPSAVDALVDKGFTRREVSWIVPQRTLSHRHKKNEQLSSNESGRWMRAAMIYALSVEVLGNEQKALAWLKKPRSYFNGESAMVFMRSETGAQLVEENLGQLDAGYFA